MNPFSLANNYSKPNRILISEDTRTLVKDHITSQKKEEIYVKGISYPVQTYEISSLIKDA